MRERWADFIDAIGKNRRPVCDIDTRHLATNGSLLGMRSLKPERSRNGTTRRSAWRTRRPTNP
ncbi:MAG: hypothetical protein GWO24_00010 [Akkermansiaceae bacterium]|nr:hypothetical protein [Akkermansiaceae bacterium]